MVNVFAPPLNKAVVNPFVVPTEPVTVRVVEPAIVTLLKLVLPVEVV